MRRLSDDKIARSSTQAESGLLGRQLIKSSWIQISLVAAWLLVSIAIIALGGINSPLILGYIIIIVTSGLYLDQRTVVLYGALSISMGTVAHWLVASRQISSTLMPDVFTWMSFASLITLGTALMWLISQRVLVAEAVFREQASLLNERNIQMQSVLKAQEEAQTHIAALLDNSPAILYTLDEESRFTLVRGRGLGLPGMEPESLPGQLAESVFGPAEGLWAKAREQQGAEAIHSFADQSLQTVLHPMQNGKCMSGLTINITQQALARASLLQSEARFRSLAENSPDFIAIYDLRNGQTLYHNREDLLGHAFDQPGMLRLLQEMIHEDHKEKVLRNWESLVQNPASTRFDTEYLLQDKVGQYHWIESRGVVLSRDAEGEPEQIMVAFSSIGERKRVEQALTESAEKLRVIFNETLDVVLVIDAREGLIREANPALQLVLGYEPNDLLGEPYQLLLGPDNQDAASFLRDIRFYGTVFSAVSFKRMNGELCELDVSATVIPWEEDLGVLVTIRDTSERERLQQQVQAAQEMHLDLERQQQEVAMRENFISVIAHQLRTPLAVIQMSADILKRYQDRLSPERHLDQIDKILTQTHRMTALMNDLLLMRQGISGKLPFSPRPLNLDEFFMEIIEPMQLKHAENHEIIYIRQTPVEDVMLDHQLMTNVVDNLLTNAIKYSPDGGRIYIELNREDDMLRLDVRDSGIGIPPEAIGVLFEMFYRAPNVGAISGNGLGLTIVRDGVKAHGGSIEIESEVGQGTRFIVRVPYKPYSTDSPPADDPSPES